MFFIKGGKLPPLTPFVAMFFVQDFCLIFFARDDAQKLFVPSLTPPEKFETDYMQAESHFISVKNLTAPKTRRPLRKVLITRSNVMYPQSTKTIIS